MSRSDIPLIRAGSQDNDFIAYGTADS